MNEVSEIENTENDGLLKKKKTRPPQSEKQKEAFKVAAAKRAENVKMRKEQKLLDAQKALLEKEGYIKQPAKKQEIQFQIEEETPDETPVAIVKELPSKKKGKLVPPPLPPKENIKKQPKVKKEPQIIIQSESSSDGGDSDDDSSSEDEVIVIKRSRKYKSKTKTKPREESPYEEDAYNGNKGYVGKSQPQINWTDMFC
jgi:hypothetical protein